MSDPNPYEPPQTQSPHRPRVRLLFVLLAILALPSGAIAGCSVCAATVVITDGNAPNIEYWALGLGGLAALSVTVGLLYFSIRRIKN